VCSSDLRLTLTHYIYQKILGRSEIVQENFKRQVIRKWLIILFLLCVR
jgi:hypothetical protein